MISWKDVLVQQERYADFRREAELDRLAKKAQAQKDGPSKLDMILHRIQGLLTGFWSAPSEPPSVEKSTDARTAQLEHRGQVHGHVRGVSHG